MNRARGTVGDDAEAAAPSSSRVPASTGDDAASSSGEHKASPFSRTVDYDTVNMLQAFNDASIDAAVVANEDGLIISVNDALLRLFGYERWEVVAHNVDMLMPEQYVRQHARAIRRYCQTGVRRTIGEVVSTLHGRRKDGSAFPLTLKVTEHWDRQQRLFFAVLRDNTVHEDLRQCRALVERMLPADIVRQLLPRVAALGAAASVPANTAKMVAQTYECTVAFVDLVDFTRTTRAIPPQRVVKLLADIFAEFDVAARAYDVEPVKTIGDCYMYMSRRSQRITAHAVNSVLMALRIVQIMKRREELVQQNAERREPTAVRIGIATGLVTSGIVTSGRLAFDAWGPVVNLAARLENLAPTNGVLVSQRTYEYAQHYPLVHFEGPQPGVTAKGIGDVQAYLARDAATARNETAPFAAAAGSRHVHKWRCLLLDRSGHRSDATRSIELLVQSMIEIGIEATAQSYNCAFDADMWDVILVHVCPSLDEAAALRVCRQVHDDAPQLPVALLVPESDWSPELCEYYTQELPIRGCFPLPVQEDTMLEWIEQVMKTEEATTSTAASPQSPPPPPSSASASRDAPMDET